MFLEPFVCASLDAIYKQVLPVITLISIPLPPACSGRPQMREVHAQATRMTCHFMLLYKTRPKRKELTFKPWLDLDLPVIEYLHVMPRRCVLTARHFTTRQKCDTRITASLQHSQATGPFSANIRVLLKLPEPKNHGQITSIETGKQVNKNYIKSKFSLQKLWQKFGGVEGSGGGGGIAGG